MKTTDTTKQSDNTMKISAVVDEVQVESSDIAHHYEDISASVDYGNILIDEIPVMEVQLINVATKEIISEETNTSGDSETTFEQVRMYDDENQKIDYELSITPVEGYEIEEQDFNISVKKNVEEEEYESESELEIEETNEEEIVEEQEENLEEEPMEKKETSVEKDKVKSEELEEEKIAPKEQVEEENDTSESESEAELNEKVTEFRSFSSNSVQPMATNNNSKYQSTLSSKTSTIVLLGEVLMTLTGSMSTDNKLITWTYTMHFKPGLIGSTGRDTNIEKIVAHNGITLPSKVKYSIENKNTVKHSGELPIVSMKDGFGINVGKVDDDDIVKITLITPVLEELDTYTLDVGNLKFSGIIFSDKAGTISNTITRISNPPTIKPVSNLDTTITGTARPGETVTIKNNVGTILGTAVANSNGNYQVTIPKQNVGTVLTATAKSSGSIQSDPTKITVTGVFDFSIKKVNPNKAPLRDATFTLSGNNYSQSLTSDSNGNIRFPNLKPGTYTLTETSAPPGYILNKSPCTVIINIDGSITVDGLTIQGAYQSISQPIVGSVQIKAVDSEDKHPLSGVTYKIKDMDVTATSDSNGIITFNNLPYGDYTLVMEKAPDGYDYDQTEILITLNKDTVSKEVPLEKRMLPDTGGPGTLIFMLLGGILVFISLILKNKTNSGGI